MEKIVGLLNIYEELSYCTNPDDVEKLRKSLNRSNIQLKEVEKESERDLCKKDGVKKLGIRNIGKSRISSVADKSREVDSLIKEAKRLVMIGNFGDDLIIEVPIQVKFPASGLVGERFASHMNRISDLLIKNNVSTIGVWGMGGVGKTTLVTHLHNMMLTKPDIYGFVYWITVSKDCSIQKLQNDIATRIGESISDKVDESQRAGLLAEALKRKKNFVLVLDDMWEHFDLNKVGLGSPKEIGYRLILTSRLKNVCLKMRCHPIIEVEPLSPKDAWTLFVESIGREIPTDLTKISTDVLQECAGLPLGIVTLAKSMIGCTDIYEWRNVLNELQNSSCKVDDMQERVFRVLRLSYERLKDDEMKQCLLYCAAYPEDYEIEINELVWSFIDAGLLEKNVGITNMFDKGLVILKSLESAALLSIKLNDPVFIVHRRYKSMPPGEKVVVLHDLIRDMALQIAGSRFMIKARSGLKGVPNEEIWTNELEVVSLIENEIEEISNFSPKGNRLSMLLLHKNYSLSCISDGFFSYLHELKHVDLSWSCIITLPKSISQLKNLTSLILRHCPRLKEFPSLTELTSLERLDLYSTYVRQLPKGIEKLIKLRYLNLDYTKVAIIGAGVISKLTALQYLAIKAPFDVEELKSLNNLEHLTICFDDFDSFSKFSTQMKMKGRPNSYSVRFGLDLRNDHKDVTINWQSDKHILLTMTLKYDRPMHLVSEDLVKWCELSNLWKTSKMERALELICEDVNMLYLDREGYLMSLADFVLDSAPNLQRQSAIKGGPKPFFNLETLIIKGCSNMKKLFPLGLLTNLQNIQDMRIFSCEGLEALIEEADDETNVGGTGHPQKFSLPKLKQLMLDNLPNLDNLCSNNKVIHTPSLKWIRISWCPKLKRMPFVVDNQHQPFPRMLYRKSDEKWIESLEWDPPESKSKITFIPRG